MFSPKVTVAQIKGIKIGEPSTYPSCLEGWIAGGGIGQVPFYLTPEQLKKLEPIVAAAAAKKPRIAFHWGASKLWHLGEVTHANLVGVSDIKEAMVTFKSAKPPTSPLKGEVILNPASAKKLEIFRARAAFAAAGAGAQKA
jgi:hypothetical protein